MFLCKESSNMFLCSGAVCKYFPVILAGHFTDSQSPSELTMRVSYLVLLLVLDPSVDCCLPDWIGMKDFVETKPSDLYRKYSEPD